MTRLGRAGFSMVEIMMSMGILALLITITVSYYGDMRADTQAHAARAELDEIKGEIQRYQMEHRADFAATTVPPDGDGRTRLDPWGQPYRLDIARHVVWSVGPNGVDDKGGGDDIQMAYDAYASQELKPPVGFRVGSFGPNWAELVWGQVHYSAGVSGYNVYRRDSASATEFTTVPLNPQLIPDAAAPSFRDDSITSGQVYYYALEVVGADGTRSSARSPVGFQIPMAGPPSITVTPASVSVTAGQTVAFSVVASAFGSAIRSVTFDTTTYDAVESSRTLVVNRTFSMAGALSLTVTAVDTSGRQASTVVSVQVH